MRLFRLAQPVVLLALAGSLSACGGFSGLGSSSTAQATTSGTAQTAPTASEAPTRSQARFDRTQVAAMKLPGRQQSSFFDLFRSTNPNTTVAVNKYIWRAALDVLDFLPIESVDPFTGVIVTGYGTPPGGGKAYRATIYVQDPALDARSLHVALESRGNVEVPAATERAVEDAILSRARQLRIADAKL